MALFGLFLLLLIAYTEGVHEYAAVCLPKPDASTSYRCELTIQSEDLASVKIHTARSRTVNLEPGIEHKYHFTEADFPVTNTEDKAIRIQSDIPVQVLVSIAAEDENNEYYSDVYLVPSSASAGTKYIATSYPGDDVQCGADSKKQFYVVTSFHDDTRILVERQDGHSFVFWLGMYGTFTRVTTDPDDHSADGALITSSKPVNVISGNLCVHNTAVGGAQKGVFGSIVSAMPPLDTLGREYIVPRIISDDTKSAGYSIGVTATEDDTSMNSSGGVTDHLKLGQTVVFEQAELKKEFYVKCSKPCLVVQYTKALNENYGVFMQHILPASSFYSSASFNTLDVKDMLYLSIVMEGDGPVDDLYLNGELLSSLSWSRIRTRLDDGFVTSALEVPRGAYELKSSRRFAVYVYSHVSLAQAAGYAVLPNA